MPIFHNTLRSFGIALINLGDTVVMIPAAAAIIAWLIVVRAWRTALWWCLLFTTGLSLVVASKIVFSGWGIGIPSINFKALSGHAMLTTAIFPVVFYLILQRSRRILRISGVLLGIVFGMLMCIVLVMGNYHSISEVVAGFVIGAIVSLSFIWLSDNLPTISLNAWLIPFSLLASFAVWYVIPPSMGYWIENVARYLSGHESQCNCEARELDT